MGLNFGWKRNDTRESIWKGDPALVDVPDHVIELWELDGEARHLEPYAKAGSPSVVEFRAMNIDESRHVLGLIGGGAREGISRAYLAAFRIGVRFKDMPERIRDSAGVEHAPMIREHGIPMLAIEFVDVLEKLYPGIVTFYGIMIFAATYPSEPEKKVSSPPSTQTRSSAAASTTAVTEVPQAAARPAA